jgi:hypothetical protein
MNAPKDCCYGWMSRVYCNYTGGCYCTREHGHPGQCVCDCGQKRTRPQSWDRLRESLTWSEPAPVSTEEIPQ